MRITNCQVNHVTNPLGFSLGDPTFTWEVEDARGSRATESRIVVTCSGATVADTGWTELDPRGASGILPESGISCPAPNSTAQNPIRPRTRYEWTVSVRSDADEEATSEPQWFETGKMGEPWQAQWITCDSTEPRHPVFSKELELRGQVASARLYVCGLGLYDAYIDGEKVGNEHLAPGTEAYDKWLQVATYDVTQQMEERCPARNSMWKKSARHEIPSRHEVSFLLGNGWYKERFGFGGAKAFYGDSWRLIAELHVTYADGTEDVFSTDGTWQVTRSNITFDSIYDGEHRDDTLPAIEPVAASPLSPEEDAAEKAKLTDRLSLPVVEQETFAPTKVMTPAGEQVLDLGQNIAGTFRLRVHEPAGTKVHLQFGELLQDGNFYRDNLRSAKAEYIYVSDGAEHVLEPHFTYYGYRYVKVEGIANVDPADFTGVALYSGMDTASGRLTTGNALVNKLIENTRWGMRDNFVDTATDCPQRDERMGWTGDAEVFSPTALLLGKPYAFYRKYLYDMAHEQAGRGGMVPMVVPAFMVNGTTAAWGDATTIIPWNMYLYTGDASILREHYEAMRSWVEWVRKQDGDSHAWAHSGMQLGDWLALDGRPGTDDRLGGTDEAFVADVYYYLSARIVEKTARVLGKTEDEKSYRELAEAQLAWIRSEYYSATGRCCIDTQTAYAMTIVYGLADANRAGRSLKRLLNENGGKLATGFVGTPILLQALCMAGYTREAYNLLLNEDYPGWLREVKLGATTIWERWNSLDDEGRITGIDMNSMNHYAYGAVVQWIWEWAAGLKLDEAQPGYAHATIAPVVDWRLHQVDAQLDSAAGPWRVAWRCLDESGITSPGENPATGTSSPGANPALHVEIEVPFGATATVELPFAPESAYTALGGHELTAGSHAVEYEPTQPIRRVPSTSWTLAALLSSPDTAEVVNAAIKHSEQASPEQRAMPLSELVAQLEATHPGAGMRIANEAKASTLDADLRALAD